MGTLLSDTAMVWAPAHFTSRVTDASGLPVSPSRPRSSPGGALVIPAVANAEEHSVSPVGFGELLAGCTSAGGEFGSAGSMDWCTV